MATVLEFPSGKVVQQGEISHDTLAGILRDLQEALGTTKRIVLKRDRSCWSATFHGFTDSVTFDGLVNPVIPCGVPVPLPFAPQADVSAVADHLLNRYPDALITNV